MGFRVLGEFRASGPGVEGLGLRAVEIRLKGDDLRFRWGLGRVSGFRARVLGFGRGFRSWVP